LERLLRAIMDISAQATIMRNMRNMRGISSAK
jgi:hypothetical protein